MVVVQANLDMCNTGLLPLASRLDSPPFLLRAYHAPPIADVRKPSARFAGYTLGLREVDQRYGEAQYEPLRLRRRNASRDDSRTAFVRVDVSLDVECERPLSKVQGDGQGGVEIGLCLEVDYRAYRERETGLRVLSVEV